MIDKLIQRLAERTAEIFRQHPDDAAMKRQQVEFAILHFQQWLDSLPDDDGQPAGPQPLPESSARPRTPDLIDPDAVISAYRCVLCGEPETTARPIITWSFSLADGHWHIQACPTCAYNRIGVHLRDAVNLQADSFDRWKVSLYKFIRENGKKVRAG